VWFDGQKQVHQGGFFTDLAAARHAAEMSVVHVDGKLGRPFTERNNDQLQACNTALYDEDTFVS
jgi:hypothetical protein